MARRPREFIAMPCCLLSDSLRGDLSHPTAEVPLALHRLWRGLALAERTLRVQRAVLARNSDPDREHDRLRRDVERQLAVVCARLADLRGAAALEPPAHGEFTQLAPL
jgi:hypothetical protein